MYDDQRIAGCDPRANRRLNHQPRGRVDPVIFPVPAGAEVERRKPDRQRVDGLDIAVTGRCQGNLHRRHRQPRVEVAALRHQHAHERFTAGP